MNYDGAMYTSEDEDYERRGEHDGHMDGLDAQDEEADTTCTNCDGKGWGFDFKGGKIVCPECHGTGDTADDDPQCVCGTYRSEHALCGCGNFQSKGSWAVEREFIGSLSDDDFEAIYHPYG